MIILRHSPWTFNAAVEESKKYTTLSDFVRSSQGCYKASKRHGWIEEFVWLDCSRKKKKEKYTYELCYSAAYSCKTLREFVNKYPRHYKKACNSKWIRDYAWLKRQSSAGEIEIERMLNIYGIRYTQQQTFPWLKSKRNMKIDFFLPDYNVGLEIQGKQHFDPDDFFCDEGTMSRDREKFELCAEHGITVMYYVDNASAINRVKSKDLLNNVFCDVNKLLFCIIMRKAA